MPATTTERERNAQAVLDAHDSNDWEGSAALDVLAAARFAVVIQREDDSWVLAADTIQDVAGLILGCYCATEGYDEWPEEIVSIETGESIAWQQRMSCRISLDGETATAHDDGGTE